MIKEMCKNCTYYVEYYTKGIAKFTKLRYGYCRKLKLSAHDNGGCENWKDNAKEKEYENQKQTETINAISKQLLDIAQVLFDNETV